jgi:hypothetical protein
MSTFSPEMEAKIAVEAAKILAEQAAAEAGGAAKLVVYDFATVTQMTRLSRHTIPKYLPVTEVSPGKFGITHENLQAYLDGKTVWPGQAREKAKAGAATPAFAK